MEHYDFIRAIGKGSFGKVYLVRHKRERKHFVMKVIKLKGIPKSEREACRNEVMLMQRLQHPNIVGYKDSFLAKNGEQLCIVMTYCDGGDLSNRVSTRRGRLFSEDQVMHWFVQIALGMQFMHENKVLHRDIKTQNIFLLGNGRLVLGDLGISKVLDGTMQFAQTQIGTPYYMSPELFRNKPYNHKSDVWALGCVLYELATLKHPFDASSLNSLASKIMRGSYPPINYRYSRSLRQLVASMLNVSPSSRPSVADVLKMPFLKKHIYNFVKDIAARSSGIGEGTAVFKAAAVRVAEGARDNPPAMGGIGRFLGAGGLGPQAEALVRQLEKLGLERVVAKALSLEEAKPTQPENPVEARKQIREKQNDLNREEERRKAVEAALARLRSEKESRQKQREVYIQRQRRRARPGRYDAERKLREKDRKMREAAARRRAHINAHRPSARDRKRPLAPSRPPGFNRRSSDQRAPSGAKVSPPRRSSFDKEEQRRLEEDKARREQAARALAARRAREERERAEREAREEEERQRREDERQRREEEERQQRREEQERRRAAAAALDEASAQEALRRAEANRLERARREEAQRQAVEERKRMLDARLAAMAEAQERKANEVRRRRAEEERQKLRHEMGGPPKFTAAEASNLRRSSSSSGPNMTGTSHAGASGPKVRDPFKRVSPAASSRSGGGPVAPTPTGALPSKSPPQKDGAPSGGIAIAGGPSTRDAVLARREAMRAAKEREERATLAAAAREGARERQAAIEKHRQQYRGGIGYSVGAPSESKAKQFKLPGSRYDMNSPFDQDEPDSEGVQVNYSLHSGDESPRARDKEGQPSARGSEVDEEFDVEDEPEEGFSDEVVGPGDLDSSDSDEENLAEEEDGMDEVEEELERELQYSTARVGELKATLEEVRKAVSKIPGVQAVPEEIDHDDDNDDDFEADKGGGAFIQGTAPAQQVQEALVASPSVTGELSSGKLADRIASLRAQCISGLGEHMFEKLYSHVKRIVWEGDDMEDNMGGGGGDPELSSILTGPRSHYKDLVERLILMENSLGQFPL